MSNHIDKDNPNRWALIQNNNIGEESIVSFGYVGEQGQTELETGSPNLSSYLTEQELEIAVDTVADNPEYYMDAVETDSSKFFGVSGIYELGVRLVEEPTEE